ncbi:DUF4397 domain-containing protein [Pedobacter rhizosphaerae]|nr:DUF4397 domain-containing protein [Pedobacter rhizosphaerae]
MKIFTNCSTQIIICLIIASIQLSSCKKHDPDVVVKGETRVKLVNAVLTEFHQDVYVDSEKKTTTALAFGESSEYVKLFSGSRNLSFMGANNVATTGTLNFTPSIVYTVFLTNNRAGEREIVSYEDNLSNTEAGKAKIKLINLTPTFGTGINVSVQAGIQFVNALLYKEASNYFAVEAGSNLRYTVVGSGNVKTIDGTLLEGGKIYTIWFSGNTSATLEAHIITDN